MDLTLVFYEYIMLFRILVNTNWVRKMGDQSRLISVFPVCPALTPGQLRLVTSLLMASTQMRLRIPQTSQKITNIITTANKRTCAGGSLICWTVCLDVLGFIQQT